MQHIMKINGVEPQGRNLKPKFQTQSIGELNLNGYRPVIKS